LLINLGSGKAYDPRFINVDVNLWHRRDMWIDLRNRFPFADREVDGVFSSHVLEHFPLVDVQHILAECARILRPGGALRVSVPSLELALAAYQSGDMEFFHGEGRTVGRRFVDHILDASNHKLMYDFPFLEELLLDVGFSHVTRAQYREASTDIGRVLCALDNRPEISLFADAVR
jgi:predicted SAM-dependent methyltransferase